MTAPLGAIGPTVAAALRAAPGVEGLGAAMRSSAPSIGAAQAVDFLELLRRGVGEVGQMQAASQDIMTRFLRGEAVEMHDVMAAAQEASLSLEMLVEIRNKLTTTWQTLLQVQI